MVFRRQRLVIAAATLLVAGLAEGADDNWIAKIRKDHPRLFFNKDMWPQVRDRALQKEKEWYASLRRRIDRYPADPMPQGRGTSPAYREKGDGGYELVELPRPREWGREAMETAFVYLLTRNKSYLETAKKMLQISVAAYDECYEKGMCVNWYSTSRVCALAAYDWLYNDLTPDERRAILSPFLKHIEAVQPGRGKRRIYRLNGSDHTSGFYGVRNLVWFAGLAAYNDGIDDATALRFLQLGYKYNEDLFNYRRQCAGDDGGLATAAVNYGMGAYPWAQFNFLHTWKSATNEDTAADWPQLALRQFVFVVPNHFVICDRVISTKPEYRKDWLLHTQNEPKIEGRSFVADEGDGRLFCRTLHPKDAVLKKVGGPGREFYAGGRNWELAPEVEKRWKGKALLGNWRIEVSPADAGTDDVFLHLIQVGEKSPSDMAPAELISEDNGVGVRFRVKHKLVAVTFATEGPPAGHIRIASGGEVLLQKNLATTVTPQAGLTGSSL